MIHKYGSDYNLNVFWIKDSVRSYCQSLSNLLAVAFVILSGLSMNCLVIHTSHTEHVVHYVKNPNRMCLLREITHKKLLGHVCFMIGKKMQNGIGLLEWETE